MTAGESAIVRITARFMDRKQKITQQEREAEDGFWGGVSAKSLEGKNILGRPPRKIRFLGAETTPRFAS